MASTSESLCARGHGSVRIGRTAMLGKNNFWHRLRLEVTGEPWAWDLHWLCLVPSSNHCCGWRGGWGKARGASRRRSSLGNPSPLSCALQQVQASRRFTDRSHPPRSQIVKFSLSFSLLPFATKKPSMHSLTLRDFGEVQS